MWSGMTVVVRMLLHRSVFLWALFLSRNKSNFELIPISL